MTNVSGVISRSLTIPRRPPVNLYRVVVALSHFEGLLELDKISDGDIVDKQKNKSN